MQNKSLQIGTPIEQSSSSLLSNEILRSLLVKAKIIMNEKLSQKKHLIKQLLYAKDSNFLQDFCMSSIVELMQLATYYDLSFNLLDDSLNIEQMSLLQLIVEFKKRDTQHKETEFIANLWKILS